MSETALDPGCAAFQCFRRLVDALGPAMPEASRRKLDSLLTEIRREYYGYWN